nr:excalibur calcium-binding domain-containing protein [Novosphingobium sp.]
MLGGVAGWGLNAYDRSQGEQAARCGILNALPAGFVFAGCNAVRARGLAPLYRGEPGYGTHMDGDGDGAACEPYP